MVEDLQQRDGVFVRGVDQFQITDGEAVEPNVMFLFNPVQLVDVLDFVVLCLAEVVEGSTCGDDPFGEVFDAETFQGVGLEMLGKQRNGIIGSEYPVLESGEQDFLAEMFTELLRFPFLNNHFCWFEIL